MIVSALLFAGTAQAFGLPQPKLGQWTAGPGNGFTLTKGTGKNRGKVLLTNFHGTTGEYGGCPTTPTVATVLGRFPLKKFTRGGASTWGIGRNVAGEPEPMAVKVRVAGTVEAGMLDVIFYYLHPATQVLTTSLTFGECSLFGGGETPKKK